MNLRLLEKARRALRPDGRIAIHDFVVDDERGDSPLFSALFSVNLLVYTRGGQTYSRREYEDMLTKSGFSDIEKFEIAGGGVGNPSCLIVGRKRAD